MCASCCRHRLASSVQSPSMHARTHQLNDENVQYFDSLFSTAAAAAAAVFVVTATMMHSGVSAMSYALFVHSFRATAISLAYLSRQRASVCVWASACVWTVDEPRTETFDAFHDCEPLQNECLHMLVLCWATTKNFSYDDD